MVIVIVRVIKVLMVIHGSGSRECSYELTLDSNVSPRSRNVAAIARAATTSRPTKLPR